MSRKIAQSCRQTAPLGEGPGWDDSRAAASSDLMAAALDEMQVKMSKLELDNARLRVDLVSEPCPHLMSPSQQR